MDTDGPPSAEKARDQNLTGAAEMKTENVETQPSPSPPDSNSNILFAAMMNLDVHLTVLHAALPLHMALLLFSGHSDLHSMSTLAAHQEFVSLHPSAKIVMTYSQGKDEEDDVKSREEGFKQMQEGKEAEQINDDEQCRRL
ncbi:hypothetical protein BJY52DRAFT_1195333 [Lactarius psammicola]|nr:hypothetical protein BJY52DRAFT_1195333 [Lactarius psammicola]